MTLFEPSSQSPPTWTRHPLHYLCGWQRRRQRRRRQQPQRVEERNQPRTQRLPCSVHRQARSPQAWMQTWMHTQMASRRPMGRLPPYGTPFRMPVSAYRAGEVVVWCGATPSTLRRFSPRAPYRYTPLLASSRDSLPPQQRVSRKSATAASKRHTRSSSSYHAAATKLPQHSSDAKQQQLQRCH